MIYEIYLQYDNELLNYHDPKSNMIESELYSIEHDQIKAEAKYKDACRRAVLLSQASKLRKYTAYLVEVNPNERLIGINGEDNGCISLTKKSHTYIFGKEII